MIRRFYFFGLFCLAINSVCAQEYVSLKSDEVNLRTGPGERFPIKYIYKKKHYPFQVLDFYEGWFHVKEIDETKGWIHESLVSKNRYVIVHENTVLLKRPSEESSMGEVQKGVVGYIQECPLEIDYCFIKFNDVKGWVKRDFLWGIKKGEEID